MAPSAPIRSTRKRTVYETDMKKVECGPCRRTRSLSQLPHHPAPALTFDPVPEEVIVNTARGSLFPEISLDDIAIESGRCFSRWNSEIGALHCSQRRGRLVTRRNYHSGDGYGRLPTTNEAAVSESNSERKRAVSVVRSRCLPSDFQTSKVLDRCRLDKSAGHTEVSNSNSSGAYSSHSSMLTDDEATDARYGEDGIEKIIRAVYARKKPGHHMGNNQNSSLYDAMRKELGHAVEEIRTELKQAMTGRNSVPGSSNPLNHKNCGALQVYSAITRTYETKLEKSEKRKQDLLAKMELEERRGKSLSKRVRELLPDSDKRRTRNEKEVWKKWEELIPSVEEKYMSSFCREKHDRNSTFSRTKARVSSEQYSRRKTSAVYNSVTVETDSINIPWLKWDNAQHPLTQKPLRCEADKSSSSSRGCANCNLVSNGENTERKTHEERPSFDMERYAMLEKNDQLLFLSWKERHRIHSGGIVLCNNLFLL